MSQEYTLEKKLLVEFLNVKNLLVHKQTTGL